MLGDGGLRPLIFQSVVATQILGDKVFDIVVKVVAKVCAKVCAKVARKKGFATTDEVLHKLLPSLTAHFDLTDSKIPAKPAAQLFCKSALETPLWTQPHLIPPHQLHSDSIKCFFFGAADNTCAARTSVRTPGRMHGRTPADDTGAADDRPTSDDTDVPGQLFSHTIFREFP